MIFSLPQKPKEPHVEDGRTTRWKEPESLLHYLEEIHLLVRNTVWDLTGQEINFYSITPLRVLPYIIRSHLLLAFTQGFSKQPEWEGSTPFPTSTLS